MKSNVFKNLKDTIKNQFTFSNEDDDYEDEYYDEDEYDDEQEEADESSSPSQQAPKSYSEPSPIDYKPDYGYNPPPYNATGAAKTAKSYSSKPSYGGNIYNMNDAKSSGKAKLRVTLFSLSDPDDAINVGDCMIERNIITIADMSKLQLSDERRVLDFLDGIKYVCKSKIETISEHIYLIVPESAELSGDFFSQVDSNSFYL